MNNAVICGLGVVGKATADSLGIKKYHDLKRFKGYEYVDLKEVADHRYIFICLPTSVNQHGRYELDTMTEIIEAIKSHGKQNVFIIRSTVHPGYANALMEKLDISCVISNPEFLTEKTVEKDSMHPDIIVIGGARKNYIEDVEGLYKARFKGADIIKTDNTTAELIKLAINGFYTTKVVFANIIYEYAGLAGADYKKVKEAMYKRKWIGKNHLSINHQGGRGAGGSCLPKDTKALATSTGSKLLRQVVIDNNTLLSESKK